MSVRQPQDRELVYARTKNGTPQRVMFVQRPARWVGSNIVYQFEYFKEWAALDGAERKPPRRS